MSWWPFSRGDITVSLPKYNFSPGETITGTMTMKLKKIIHGNSVNVRLLGEETVSQGFGRNRQTRTYTVFDFDQPLDGEKDYAPGTPLTYNFQIKIPENVLQQRKMPEGTLGTIANVAQVMSGTRRNIKWQLVCRLDIPKAIDLRKRVQVNIA